MAGDWIKMRADLFTHPKVFRIAQLLGKDELYVVGALFCFWAWVDKHSVDGRVDGATSQLVDRMTRVDGLADALVDVRWLNFDPSGAAIPAFSEHNGNSAKDRAQKNSRQARWRDRKANGLVDVDASTNASTREEKRREEKKEQKQERGASPIGSRLAADWVLPDEWREWAKAERSDLDIRREAASFADYWQGLAGAKARKADWFKTWCNWIRRADAPKRGRAPVGDVFAGAL